MASLAESGHDPRQLPVSNAGTFSFRCYQSGDDAAIVRLFHAAHRDFGGYVVRDEAHWAWCVKNRPGMVPENIFILDGPGGETLAYAAMSGSGTVLEFAVTPDASLDQRRRMASALLETLEQRGRTLGLDAIKADLPTNDEAIRDAAEAAGYRLEANDSLQFVVMDLVTLLEKILGARAAALRGLGGRAVFLEVAAGNCRFLSSDRIMIRAGESVTVEPAPAPEPAAALAGIDQTCLMDIIFHRLDPDQAIQSGRVRGSAEDLPVVAVLLRALPLPCPWYIPNSDGR